MRIDAENLSVIDKYVKEIYLNGNKFKKMGITNAEIVKGGKLTFVMTDKIN